MQDGRCWWLSAGFLLLSTGGTWLYLRGRSENEVKLAKGIMDALLAVWSVGSILALAPRPGLRHFDIRIAIQALPVWLSLLLIGVALLLGSSKIAVAIVEARLARRRVKEEKRRQSMLSDSTNTVLFAPRQQREQTF